MIRYDSLLVSGSSCLAYLVELLHVSFASYNYCCTKLDHAAFLIPTTKAHLQPFAPDQERVDLHINLQSTYENCYSQCLVCECMSSAGEYSSTSHLLVLNIY